MCIILTDLINLKSQILSTKLGKQFAELKNSPQIRRAFRIGKPRSGSEEEMIAEALLSYYALVERERDRKNVKMHQN